MKKKIHILLIINIFYTVVAIAQTCGTMPTEEQVNYMRSFETASVRDMVIAQGIIDIPIQFHIVTRYDGSGGIGIDTLRSQLQHLNRIFIKSNIRFIEAAKINYINDSQFYDFYVNKEKEKQIAQTHNSKGLINIYCTNQLLSPSGYYFGYAYHPQKIEERRIRVFMSRVGFQNNSTFAHEMGHFFGLFHTHGKSDQFTDEAISRTVDSNKDNRPDCEQTGDDLCDTPADPNIGHYAKLCSKDCYLINNIDIQGSLFSPLVDNIMSYNQNRDCRTKFTEGQYARVAQFARNEWKDLRIKDIGNKKQAKGTVQFKLKNKKAMPITLEDINLYQFKKTYRTGDSFLYRVRNNSETPFYVSILNMDNQVNEVNVIPTIGKAVRVQPSERVTPIKKYIKLKGRNQQPSQEFICLLVSLVPIDHKVIGAEMEKVNGTFTQRIYQVLGNQLLPRKNVHYSDGEEIGFEGRLAENEILPIMLTMKHIPK